MSDQYTGKAMDRRYSGEAVDITYSARRCIHAEECIHRLSEVFDAKRRPWILPGATTTNQVAQAVEHCPSGALHYDPKDSSLGESIPTTNSVMVWHNGPLQFSGDLRIEGTTVSLQEETRATLCRCGGSQSKPFCDNSHKSTNFDGTLIAGMTVVPDSEGGTLKVTVTPNGPLAIEGAFTLYDENNAAIYSGRKTTLCRCGESGKKPFCDGTHKTNGFIGE